MLKVTQVIVDWRVNFISAVYWCFDESPKGSDPLKRCYTGISEFLHFNKYLGIEWGYIQLHSDDGGFSGGNRWIFLFLDPVMAMRFKMMGF